MSLKSESEKELSRIAAEKKKFRITIVTEMWNTDQHSFCKLRNFNKKTRESLKSFNKDIDKIPDTLYNNNIAVNAC